MRRAVKGRSGIVVGVVSLAVVSFSLVGNLAGRIGVVEPRVMIERSAKESDAAQAATRMRLRAVRRAMNGEVSMTADRLREAAALAAAASLIAVNERRSTGAEGWNLLRRVASHNLLPPGAELTKQSNTLSTPCGALVLHFRSMPRAPLEPLGLQGAPGVEVLSLGKDKTAGPALIIRVAAGIQGAGGMKVWMATTLERPQLPRPFAGEPEMIAAGWQAMDLRAGQ